MKLDLVANSGNDEFFTPLYAIEERKHFVVEEDDYGEKMVYVIENNEKRIYDDMGDLSFIRTEFEREVEE